MFDVQPKITPVMAESFLKPVDRAEVNSAIFQLGALKAPGPNVMSSIFYQHCWDIVGKDLTDVVIFFFLKWSNAKGTIPH